VPWARTIGICALLAIAGCGGDRRSPTPRAAVAELLSAAAAGDAGGTCARSTPVFALGCNGIIEDATASEAARGLARGVRWTVDQDGSGATVTLRRGRWRSVMNVQPGHDGWRVSSWETFASSGY